MNIKYSFLVTSFLNVCVYYIYRISSHLRFHAGQILKQLTQIFKKLNAVIFLIIILSLLINPFGSLQHSVK